MNNKIVGFTRRVKGIGGPSTFQLRLEKELKDENWTLCYPDEGRRPNVIIVFGPSKRLFWIFWNKLKGAVIVHRLTGIQWKYDTAPMSFKDKVQSFLINSLVEITRRYAADYLIYQSEFLVQHYKDRYGALDRPSSIIYNGTDLDIFYPGKSEDNKTLKLICVEGNLDDEPGIILFLKKAASTKIEDTNIHLTIVGNAPDNLKTKFQEFDNISFVGKVPKDEVAIHLRRQDVFLTLDLNPACPNAIIEALASGLPVLGFETGAVGELVNEEVGVIMPYVNDPWKLETPSLDLVEDGIKRIQKDLPKYKENARKRAEKLFDIKKVSNKYMTIFEQTIDG